jgi:probable HAF family extracellular repeat protein
MNDQGQVVGGSTTTMDVSAIPYATHAFLYTGGRLTDIHTLGAKYSSVAAGINNSGNIVGYFAPQHFPTIGFQTDSSSRAFFYNGSIGSQIVDLNTLIDPASGWVLQSAAAINDAGQIVGTGFYNKETYTEAFSLTPIR